MNKELSAVFSMQQLALIREEGLVYMCACPAQIAEQLVRLGELYEYQIACLSENGLTNGVHERIAESTRNAHAELEQCLQDVLRIEGWDMKTLKMPEGLRVLREKIIDQE